METPSLIQIESGNFTAKGNFSGYDVIGERYHIPARVMNALGFTPDNEKDIKYPFFVVEKDRTFNVLDEDGKPTDKTFVQPRAGSAFADEERAINAFIAKDVLNLKAQSRLASIAKENGLSTAVVAELEKAKI